MHVVQISILHINALKTQLMHKNVETNPENHKNHTTLQLFHIWIMHINGLETLLMHKNYQTNPEKSQKYPQHSCCSMLTWEKLESNKRQWNMFRPQRWDVPYRKPSCLLWEALVCEKHIPKPAPNGTKFYYGMWMPLHDSMPCFMNFRQVLDLL